MRLPRPAGRNVRGAVTAPLISREVTRIASLANKHKVSTLYGVPVTWLYEVEGEKVAV